MKKTLILALLLFVPSSFALEYLTVDWNPSGCASNPPFGDDGGAEYLRSQRFTVNASYPYLVGVSFYLNSRVLTPSGISLTFVNLSGGKPDYSANYTTITLPDALLSTGAYNDFNLSNGFYKNLGAAHDMAVLFETNSSDEPAGRYYTYCRSTASLPLGDAYTTKANKANPALWTLEDTQDVKIKFYFANAEGDASINNATYNVTSAWNNTDQIVWRSNASVIVNTYDATPTIKFSTNGYFTCAICTLNLNFTDMVGNGACNNASETNSTTHTATLAAGLSYGLNNVYLSCLGMPAMNTSLSGALPIFLDQYGYIAGRVTKSGVALNNATLAFNYLNTTLATSVLGYTNSSGHYNVSVGSLRFGKGNWLVSAYYNTTIRPLANVTDLQ